MRDGKAPVDSLDRVSSLLRFAWLDRLVLVTTKMALVVAAVYAAHALIDKVIFSPSELPIFGLPLGEHLAFIGDFLLARFTPDQVAWAVVSSASALGLVAIFKARLPQQLVQAIFDLSPSPRWRSWMRKRIW